MVVAFIFLFCCFIGRSATITSTSSGGNWDDINSWVGGIIPGSGDDVIIASSAIITVTADADVSSLDVEGTIIVNDGVTLSVGGNVIVQTGAFLYLSGNTSCTGNNVSVLSVYGNYSNFGISCFWKSWVIVAGNLYSPNPSGIQSSGYLVIGGDAIGVIDQTGGNSVYPINPNATISLSGTTPTTTIPTSPAELVEIIDEVIFSGSCGFTINGPSNVTSCSGSSASFIISTTTATFPVYLWEENRGVGWNVLNNGGTYSGVTTSTLSIASTTGMDGYLYRCKISNNSLCSKYSYSATLNVTPLNTITLTSGASTNSQSTCINNSIIDIAYSTTGATGATITGLPAGVTENWAADKVTISGTPSISGTFNYTVTPIGGCGIVTSTGTIAVTPENTITLTSGAGTNIQTRCLNSAISSITYLTSGAAGASVTGLPVGVSGNLTANTLTISGTPSVTGTFNFIVTLLGGCGTASAGGTISVTPNNTIMLTSGPGTNNQTRCINTAITNITYSTTGATGAIVSGLPAGITGSWASNIVTINGAPSVSGTFNYTVMLTGGCGTVTTSGSIAVTPANTITLTSGAGTNNQTRCVNTAISNITYLTTGATGASVTGLPAGVTGNWAANILTISGTPTVSGTFNYTITLIGGCGIASSTGSIVITPVNTITFTSGAGTNNQTRCINTAIADITYSTTGATGAAVTGLPAGVIGSWVANTVTISGTPVVSGVFNYTVTLSGGCGIASATGSIVVTSNNTIVLTSPAGTNNQIKCINTPVTNITYTTSGASGASVTGLPAGVTGNWAANVLTISGTPSLTGIYNYIITLSGGCGSITASGTITVTPDNTISLTSAMGSDNQTICINMPIINITYSTTGASGATVTGLPSGITGAWIANVLTISGSPAVAGTFNYTITLTGGCGTVSKTGTITATPLNTITLTSGAATRNQTKCINTPITNIVFSTTGATGASVTGLPAGLTTIWSGNVVTISGTPSISGIYSYVVTLAGGCGTTSTAGTITVIQDNSITLVSSSGTDNQVRCINTPVTNITYATTGATGASVTGLPLGVSGNWVANVFTISGTPVTSGTYNYSVTLTGGCGTVTAGGSIVVTPINSIILTSGISTINQNRCINNAITNINYTTSGATGATFTGLPAGITGSWAGNFITISGTPTVTGTFNYTVSLSGGCGTVTTGGTITVTPGNTISLTSAPGTDFQSMCINTPIASITYTATGATGAGVTGLPSGVTGIWSDNNVIISGTPTAQGNFTYKVTLSGGCDIITATGTISVSQQKQVGVTVSADSNPICAGKLINLTANPVNGGQSTSYQWKVNGSNVGNSNGLYSYIPVNNDIVTVVMTSGETCIAGNPATSVPLNITVTGLPSAPAVNSITQPNCAVPTGSVVLSSLPSGNWTVNPGNITGNTGSTTINGLNPGSYSFNVTSTSGCISPGSVNVLINSQASNLSVSIVEKTDVLCYGTATGTITVTSMGGQSPFRYKLGSGAYQSSGTFNSFVAGSYIITVEDANLCSSDIQAVIAEPEQMNLSYTSEEASCQNNADGIVTLNITGGAHPYSVLWSDGVHSANRSGILPGNYRVTVTDGNGCTSSFDVTVGVNDNGKCIEIQEIITPNNDGHYDTWKIKNIEMYPDAEVHLYNRWGKEVFSTRNISANEWDGTMNGETLPTDSYRYVLYLEKDLKPMTGNVTIVR